MKAWRSSSSPRLAITPFPASVTVEPVRIRDGGYLRGDQPRLSELFSEQGLAQVLRDHRVFARTYSETAPGASTDSSCAARSSRVGIREESRISSPGGQAASLLAPNWHGTRMEYFTDASIDLIDVRTGERRATYQASTAHEVIHRSATPGPFFGAAIIVPNVVRGARFASERAVPRGRLSGRLLPALGGDRGADRRGSLRGIRFRGEGPERERCGSRLDQSPRIGQRWSEFVSSCQSNYYELDAEVHLAEGSASVFVQTESGSRISVVDDVIVRWENSVASPARDTPRR